MQTKSLITENSIFNRTDVVAVGWYWLMPSHQLPRQAVRPVRILGYELAVFRGTDGTVAALDAYCPHMGAHLSEGKVEGNQLRCFFHNWCFDKDGACTDIPCMQGNNMPRTISTRSWHVRERHQLIWIWLGEGAPTQTIPEPPELAGSQYHSSLGNHFIKNCHPNVVMINAIDEQHFRTVHHLPGEILTMAPDAISQDHIEFRNQGKVPQTKPLEKLISRLYSNRLTYDLDYWYGSTGTIVLGPDFLHLYIMFALRLTDRGKTEGYCLVFAKKRNRLLSLFNWFILWLTKVAAFYFATGDTRVFQTIRFRLTTPIAADRAVVAFIQHLDKQQSFPANQPAK